MRNFRVVEPGPEPSSGETPATEPVKVLVKRHTLLVRLTHWVNAISLGFLLLSGLQIFNAHPHLYWGQASDFGHGWLSIGGFRGADGRWRGLVLIGGHMVRTTAVLGASPVHGVWTVRAFPAWLTLPGEQYLALGRRWHFFFAWLFAINGAIYMASALVGGHLRRDLVPTASQLKPSHVLAEIWHHLRLTFPKGEEAKHYNVLQKGAYLGVVALLLPLMVLTGMTMSPSLDAMFPWLVELFGGRQSARSIHFIVASLIVLFFVVHIVMVVLSGTWNNLRSMVTGRYAIEVQPTPEPATEAEASALADAP